MSDLLLEVKDLNKVFPGVKALDDVQLNIRRGEVHSLMGENGAGKSTLIKIISGVYERTSGTIFFDGKEYNPFNMAEANRLGISTIFQELDLVPTQTVYENMFLGREIINNYGKLDRDEMIKQSKTALQKFNLSIDVEKRLDYYSVAIQQMISIARAIMFDSKLVIMDEPTSALDKNEVEILMQVIDKLRDNGISVLFISHNIDEVFYISDRMTILRNGKFIGEYEKDAITELEAVSLMIGKKYTDNYQKRINNSQTKSTLLEALHLSDGEVVKDVNLNIKKGEIVGLAGLLGSGRTETAKILFGTNPTETGDIYWQDNLVEIDNEKKAISLGMGYCTEDRPNEGIFPNSTVKENLSVVLIDKISKYGFINFKKENEIVNKFINILDIKTPSPNQKMNYLSGGNQQKVLLARWMSIKPKLIILDEPTLGIDVGTKREIEKIVRRLADSGISILYISSEIDELVRNCDRIIVLRNGKSVSQLEGEKINQDVILETIASSENQKDSEETISE